MIQINKIKPFKCRAYDPAGKYIGKLNDFEFNDLRAQIKEQILPGYYMKFNGEKIEIYTDGRCHHWPNGFYDMFVNQSLRIMDF